MKTGNGLTVVIDLRDKEGKKTGEKEVATYQGLLAKAHDEGLTSITTSIVQVPSKENGDTAIVHAVVVTKRGQFTGIGDANPTNVGRRMVAHILRMAETRAKARAIRDAVNIGIVALEELGDLVEDNAGDRSDPLPSEMVVPLKRDAVSVGRKGEEPMSDAQRRFLFRLATSHGAKPEEAKEWLEQELGIASLGALTVGEASRCITKLQANGTTAGPMEAAR